MLLVATESRPSRDLNTTYLLGLNHGRLQLLTHPRGMSTEIITLFPVSHRGNQWHKFYVPDRGGKTRTRKLKPVTMLLVTLTRRSRPEKFANF
jgi:hypothetical protein